MRLLMFRSTIYGSHSRFFSAERRSRHTANKDHYSILGVHPKSTQQQIKAAYYNLSKVFHPDINQSLDSDENFRRIVEAYEVLGNYESRRKYDRGLFSRTVVFDSSKRPHRYYDEDTPYDGFQGKPTFTGRTPIYNFDEHLRIHYGTTFQEDMLRRKQYEFYRRRMQVAAEKDSAGTLVNTFALLFTVFFLTLSTLVRTHDYDYVPEKKDEK